MPFPTTFAVLLNLRGMERSLKGPVPKINGCSSIGRVAVSKTVGWEFESLHPCKEKIKVVDQ